MVEKTITLTPEELKVLKTIIEFHMDDVGDYYDFNAFNSLTAKVMRDEEHG